jgi:hypothetical protein
MQGGCTPGTKRDKGRVEVARRLENQGHGAVQRALQGQPMAHRVLMECTHPSLGSMLSQRCQTLCMEAIEEQSRHEDHGTRN